MYIHSYDYYLFIVPIAKATNMFSSSAVYIIRITLNSNIRCDMVYLSFLDWWYNPLKWGTFSWN